ncbi:MAG: hypothetical protein ACTSWF_13775 [Candidatus Freyarchaeota archaeon]
MPPPKRGGLDGARHARLLIAAPARITLRTSRPNRNSPQALPPGFGGVDWRTDIYQLGAVLYEMLTGRPPFPASEPTTLIRSVIQEQPRNPRELNSKIPEEIGEATLKALSKQKDERFKSVDLMMNIIEKNLKT